MKCYAIQFNDKYIRNVPQPLRKSWNDYVFELTDDEDLIKHYKSIKLANKWLSAKRVTLNKHKVNTTKMIDEYTQKDYGNYYISSLKNQIVSADNYIQHISNCVVIELDVVEPSFNKQFNLRWTNINNKPQLKIEVDTTASKTCKSCGLRLKKVPYLNLSQYGSCYVCIPCIKLQQENIDKAFARMSTELKDAIEFEHIIGGI